ncbi:RHS repeat-associated core domain-containing protein [Akkermansia muciniphila]|uniref:RHS repeat domain-containing protein n=1 Tax=Akkermansia muciniphila TaxID=239935 RepID=UPI00160485F4|nr:RHS repeat-associated core domain-containing protein [Akkermansia muciniphila]QNB43402.1 RHS repeat-associated core domain-containing protein [Akkermansia muciniphila]
MSKHSSCLIHRNFLAGISYSDATPGQSFAYNHLGQLTQITDASGTRTFAYNPYGEPETDCLEANGISWQVSELYDGLGRPAGYELSAGGRRVQQARLSYDGKGRLSTLAAEGMETPFSWTYCEQGGLVEQLAYPNGMTRVNTYENSRDLLSVIDYRRPGSANPPARHEYDYDALGRPTRRRDTWNTAAPKTTRLFTYNSRGELVGDQLRPGGRFGYQYDNIGNRKEAFEFGSTTDYETDELNRYAGIAGNGGEAFTPQYDADGNQTLVKTSTGIWTVTYNAENRPVKFESEDGGTTVECAYDSMGRRFEKKVTVGGTTGFHARYLYRDHLQVAECDLTGETPVLVRSYLWDPSEPQATRVLAMTRWEANGTQVKEHLYCMHDAMKNVTSLFGEARGRRALYEYRPYGGLVTSEGNMAQENKFRFSSEYMDDELGLIYYNYRHLNPRDGRWISRDPIMEQGGWNLYSYIYNSPTISNDIIGLYTVSYEVNLGVIGAPFYAKIQGEIQTNPYFKVSGEFYAAWQWTIPGVKKIDKLASKYLGIHFDAGIRVGTKAKISYSGCKKLSNIKVCGSAEAFSVIEYRRRGYRNKSTGRFNRQRFGINASGSGDLCLNLCNGDISLQANISWSAYVNIGVLGFNKTISGGGNYSFPEKNLVTIPSLAILKKYCNS